MHYLPPEEFIIKVIKPKRIHSLKHKILIIKQFSGYWMLVGMY